MTITKEQMEEMCEGVETDINKRWEKGTGHHPKSVELMKFLEYFDLYFVNDCFGWKTGGDGDNGETLMYEMDVFFEAQEKLPDSSATGKAFRFFKMVRAGGLPWYELGKKHAENGRPPTELTDPYLMGYSDGMKPRKFRF